MILCACTCTCQDQFIELSVKHHITQREHAKGLFKSYKVKIARLYDYQTWQTHFFLEIHEVHKGL